MTKAAIASQRRQSDGWRAEGRASNRAVWRACLWQNTGVAELTIMPRSIVVNM